jgi:hypothetical protein
LPPLHVFDFQVKDGKCEGDIKIDSGYYYVQCFTYGKIKVGEDSVVASDFWCLDSIKIDRGDTAQFNLKLGVNYSLTFGLLLLKDGTTPLNGTLDSLFGQGVVASCSGVQKVENGYSSGIYFYPVKKNLSFYCAGKKYAGIFNIASGMDSDIVVMSVTEVKGDAVINISMSFAADEGIKVIDVFPKEDAVNVPTDIPAVIAYFNMPFEEWSEMSNADVEFGVAALDGSQMITGTYGFSSNFFSRNMDDGHEAVRLHPNTKYVAHVGGIKDQYGNEMTQKTWCFTTGN